MSSNDVDYTRTLEDLHSEDATIRKAALWAIQQSKIKEDPLKSALQTIALDDEDPNLRRSASEILAEWDALPSKSTTSDLFTVNAAESDREIILRTLRVLEMQQKMLAETQSKVGCLYQFMIVSLILSVISAILSLG